MINKFNALVQDNGFLTEQGEKLVVEKFEPAINEFLDNLNTENEVRILGSILSNIIGKVVANTIQQNKDDKSII